MSNATATTPNRRKANKALAALTQYYPTLPMATIDGILEANGFAVTEPAIYCGREGRVNMPVGCKTYLTMSWYRMDSGRYEVVAYLS